MWYTLSQDRRISCIHKIAVASSRLQSLAMCVVWESVAQQDAQKSEKENQTFVGEKKRIKLGASNDSEQEDVMGERWEGWSSIHTKQKTVPIITPRTLRAERHPPIILTLSPQYLPLFWMVLEATNILTTRSVFNTLSIGSGLVAAVGRAVLKREDIFWAKVPYNPHHTSLPSQTHRFVPLLVITEDEIDEALSRFEKAMPNELDRYQIDLIVIMVYPCNHNCS